MALWGKTDAAASKPKYLTAADKAKTVFVSAEEAVLKTNKDKGILGAGWWLVNEYTDSSGSTRYKAEHLVAMSIANAVSGDAADDAKVADTEVTVTITQQPGTSYIYAGDTVANFSVTASASAGTVTYQWLTQAAGATDEWVEIDGETNSTLAYQSTIPDDYGRSFKVIVGSTAGAVKTESDVAQSLED